MTLLSNYQKQPKYIQVYRWWRWKPIYTIYGLWCVFKWLIRGAKPIEPITFADGYTMVMTRKQTLESIWRGTAGFACFKMKHCFALEDMIADLQKKINGS